MRERSLLTETTRGQYGRRCSRGVSGGSGGEDEEGRDALGRGLGLGRLDEAAALEPAADVRVTPVLVRSVAGAVVVLAEEGKELVASVGGLGLYDAVLLKPVAL